MTDESSTTEEHCFRLTGEIEGAQLTFDPGHRRTVILNR